MADTRQLEEIVKKFITAGEVQALKDVLGRLGLVVFDGVITTAEEATFTPWTDGWAVGYKVTAPDKPERFIFLNPSESDSEGQTNAFVYIEDGDPNQGYEKLNCFHFYTIWDET